MSTYGGGLLTQHCIPHSLTHFSQSFCPALNRDTSAPRVITLLQTPTIHNPLPPSPPQTISATATPFSPITTNIRESTLATYLPLYHSGPTSVITYYFLPIGQPTELSCPSRGLCEGSFPITKTLNWNLKSTSPIKLTN